MKKWAKAELKQQSLLSKLMGFLGIMSVIIGILTFVYVHEINEEQIEKTTRQELRTDAIMVSQQLMLLYRTIFYAYGDNPDIFKRVVEHVRYKFIKDIRSNRLFKSQGLLIKVDNKIQAMYGQNIPQLFALHNLKNDSITEATINGEKYYLSYLRFKPFHMEVIFYDTEEMLENQILKESMKTLAVVILFTMLLLTIVFLFIKRLVLAPISEIIESISKIAKKNYQYITQKYDIVEFELVKKYFNAMIDAIKERERKIHSSLKELSNRELFYYDLLNSQDDIIIVNDGKKIEHVNTAFYEFFQKYKDLDEFLKEHQCVCDFFEKEEGFVYKKEHWLEELLQTPNEIHKVKIKMNSQEYIFKITARYLEYSDRIIVILTNITELEKEKNRVLELNTLLEDYKKAIDAGIIVSKTDTQGIITYVNDEFCKVSGYQREELIGKPHNIIHHPDAKPELFKTLWETIKAGKIWKGEFKNKRKNGKAYHVKSIIAPLKNKDGEIIEYISLSEDITDLIEAIKKAKEAEQVKMLFLSNMSHEIRTPLNGILGFTELLLKSNNLPEREKRYITTIHSSSQALLQIINDVLDISKIESGHLSLEKKPFKPICAFKQAAELFKARAKEKHINYKIDLDFHLTGLIISDEFRIRQVISNLIGNAIKFTPENGEVIFSVKQIQRQGDKAKLRFSVKDTGIGIPKDKQKDIFKEFTQADNSVSRKYGGTGLGLSISAKIVKALGGELKVKSEEGKGSEFYFCIEVEVQDDDTQLQTSLETLNIALYKIHDKQLFEYLRKIVHLVEIVESDNLDNYDLIISREYLDKYKDKLILLGENNDNNVISIAENYDTSDILNALMEFIDKSVSLVQTPNKTSFLLKNKILIAEDNEVNQELIKALFDEKGLRYVIANNGVEAVELYKKEKFDLVFMDVNMPELDGVGATQQIKQYEKENNLPHTPIIALTANAMQGDKEKFLQYMDDYLTKPIMEDELNRVLNQYLSASIEIHNNTEEFTSYDKEQIARKLGVPSALFDKILNKFLETIDEYMDELKNSIEKNDLEQIYQHAHKIKGSVMTFHIDEVVEILKNMEQDARDKKERDYMSDYKKVQAELENFKTQMKGS
ncbi:MAG: response regulator [Epsilonproteobacteria bacterium]|nr:response regulator [Campylobacterota bacterium]